MRYSFIVWKCFDTPCCFLLVMCLFHILFLFLFSTAGVLFHADLFVPELRTPQPCCTIVSSYLRSSGHMPDSMTCTPLVPVNNGFRHQYQGFLISSSHWLHPEAVWMLHSASLHYMDLPVCGLGIPVVTISWCFNNRSETILLVKLNILLFTHFQ